MTWQVLPDDTTRTNAMTSGSVQAIDAVRRPTSRRSRTRSRWQRSRASTALRHVQQTTFSNVQARQAVLYALDYAKICDTGMAGLATPATCFVQDGHPRTRRPRRSTPRTRPRPVLLSEAGITTINLLCTDHGWFSAVRPIIRENLRPWGDGQSTTRRSLGHLLLHRLRAGAWDVSSLLDPSVFGNDADLLMRWWYSGDVWTESRMHWKGSESQVTVKPCSMRRSSWRGDKRVAKWRETFDKLSEDVPLYPIFHRKAPTAYDSTTLENFKPIALTGLSLRGDGFDQVLRLACGQCGSRWRLLHRPPSRARVSEAKATDFAI